MGCGESKHAVATTNTITKTKSRGSSKSNDVLETTTTQADPKVTNDTAPKQEEANNNNANDSKEVQPQEGEKPEAVVVAKSEKENDGGAVNTEEEIKEVEKELKGSDTVEAIISEGISGKTEYYSPPNDKAGVSTEEGKKSNDAVEEKGAVEEEAKTDTEINIGAAEPVKVEEEKDQAAAATVPIVKTETPATTTTVEEGKPLATATATATVQEEKVLDANKENVGDSSTEVPPKN